MSVAILMYHYALPITRMLGKARNRNDIHGVKARYANTTYEYNRQR